MTSTLSSANVATLIPLLTLIGTAACILLFDLRGIPWRFSAWVALASLVIVAALTLIVAISGQGDAVQGMLSGDRAAIPFALFLHGVGSATVLFGIGCADETGQQGGTYALLLLTVAGGMIVAQSIHMLPLAIGLAILLTAACPLLGPRAAWRALIAHGIGLAILLLGIALLYGAAGSLRLDSILEHLRRQAVNDAPNSLTVLGIGLFVAGLTPVLAAAPFHTWLPTAYRKAQPIGGFVTSLALPGTALAALAPLVTAYPPRVSTLLAVLGSLSILSGTGLALRSQQIRNALAGITIAQTGSLLLALSGTPALGRPALLYIMISNTLGLAGLWAMAHNVRRADHSPILLQDLTGLGHRRPWLAGAATICLLNLAGAPPLAGGVAHLYLLRAVRTEHSWALIPTLLGTLFTWLLTWRWLSATWMHPLGARRWLPTTPEIALIALGSAAGTLAAGLYADGILNSIANLLPLV